MRWNKFRLKTTAQAEEPICAVLMDLGIEGAQLEDSLPLTAEEKKQMFVDIAPIEEGGEEAYISFYLGEDEDKEELLSKLRKKLEALRAYVDIGEASIAESKTEEEDWINNWKQYFHQFTIGDILILPSWEEEKEEDKDKLLIRIDPGTAFGTGMHETTKLCIREIRKYAARGGLMLDVGCGSGILGILALKLGARYAVEIDLDPFAAAAAKENMQRNGIGKERYQIILGNLIDDEKIRDEVGYGRYCLAAANILAETLAPLAPVVFRALKEGGVFITSGIIEGKEEMVKAALAEAGFEILGTSRQGEWAAVSARKNG